MRSFACALMWVPLSVFAAEPADRLISAELEQRFHKADKGRKGKLTREEAYAEFPRMPEYFDEIDANKDNFITLVEVNRAMQRRVDAAINAGNSARRYGNVEAGKADAAGVPASTEPRQQFATKAEARRHYRNQYFESLAGSTALPADPGGRPGDLQVSPVLIKPY